MKQTPLLILLTILLIAGVTSCKRNNTYANDLKEERKLIADFIQREGINVVTELPEYDAWGEKDFYEIDDYLYFHLSLMGDTATDEVVAKDKIQLRYRYYTLNAVSDTVSYWNTNDSPYPVQFQYLVSDENIPSAWHKAVEYMKYSGAQATIICPSKLNISTIQNAVIPYGYDLKMQIMRY